VSNENPSENRRLAAVLGIFVTLFLVTAFFGLMLRSQTLVRGAEKRCDGKYRAALSGRADLAPVKECYVNVLRAKPWNSDVTFKIQSVGDLVQERTRAQPDGGPLSRLALGDLAACDGIEAEPRLATRQLRTRWLQLCIMLTR